MPELVRAGRGYRFHITGLTHNEQGYPVMNAECQEQLVTRLVDKIRNNTDRISLYYEDGVEDADVVVLSYGITSRVTMRAIRGAREQGLKVGHLRLAVVWPFPEDHIYDLSQRLKAFVVPEINLGQVVLEVERCSVDTCQVVSVQHAGGAVHNPQTIYNAIVEAAR